MKALADFGSSEYLLTQYIEATGALRDYEEADSEGQESRARDALYRAAKAVCNGLGELARDKKFWNALAGLREQLDQHKAEITGLLDELDLFLVQEEAVLLKRGVPRPMVLRFLAETGRALNLFKGQPDARLVDGLQEKVAEASKIACEVGDLHDGKDVRRKFHKWSVLTRDGGTVLVGAMMIVNNATYPMPPQLALTSVAGGVLTMLTCLNWLQPRRRG